MRALARTGRDRRDFDARMAELEEPDADRVKAEQEAKKKREEEERFGLRTITQAGGRLRPELVERAIVPDYALWPQGGRCSTSFYYRKLA